jgi:inorganic pyrophosphatase
MSTDGTVEEQLALLFQAHPWHGLSPGARCPAVVTCYIEIVSNDTVKYEIDKRSGLLTIDRPQRYSNFCPTLYGFIPQTCCGRLTGERCASVQGSPGSRATATHSTSAS